MGAHPSDPVSQHEHAVGRTAEGSDVVGFVRHRPSLLHPIDRHHGVLRSTRPGRTHGLGLLRSVYRELGVLRSSDGSRKPLPN